MSFHLALLRRLTAAGLLIACSMSIGSPCRAQTLPDPAPELETPPETAPESAPEAAGLELSYDATIASTYLFQGIDYSYGRSVFQPNASARWRGLAANAWANVQAGSMAANEIDLSVKYERGAGRLTAGAGYLHLRYPNRDRDPSHEAFFDFAWPAPLEPSLSVHYDFGPGDGAYTTLGLRHELPNRLEFAGRLFHQSHYYGMSGLCAAELKMSATFALGTATLTHSASYFRTWENGDFRGAAALPSRWLVAINVAR